MRGILLPKGGVHMVRLDLLGVGLVEETGGILVVLRSAEQHRLFVIETGLPEGQAIALEARGIRSGRPLTQDLLHEVIGALGARVEEARIEAFEEEAFLARLVLVRARDGGGRMELDARPSDAIALALRAGAPITVSEELMAEMGVPEEKTGRFAELFEDGEGDGEAPGERVIH